MEIIDVTYNFEMYEDLALKALGKFNEALDKVVELKEVWEQSKELKDITKTDPWFQNLYHQVVDSDDNGKAYEYAYNKAKQDIMDLVVNALGDFKVATKKLENAINYIVAVMRSRVEYVESSRTQDELYGNYKIRTERNDLNRKIKKYERLKEEYLKTASKHDLSWFGLEVDSEPDLN